jgi:hypothetical protein
MERLAKKPKPTQPPEKNMCRGHHVMRKCHKMLHVWNIYLQNCVICWVNLGKYSIHGASGIFKNHGETANCQWEFQDPKMEVR